MISSGISGAAITSVHLEKTRLKKLMKMMMMMMIINHKKQRFLRAPEIDFRYETEARKVMVDFKFDALYR